MAAAAAAAALPVVAPLLAAASRGLSTGELLHVPAFSLFDAMSAMEIGHPKMDPGARGGPPSAAPLRDRELGLDLVCCADDPAGAARLLGLLDHLLAQEATHLSGGGLANTVYSCIYMMQIDRCASNPVLHAYCAAVQDTCVVANYLVTQGCACEEEDFSVFLSGLPLEEAAKAMNAAPHAQRVPSACKLLDAAIDLLSTKKSALSAALRDRLLFRRQMLEALSSIKADLPAAAAALQAAAQQVVNIKSSAALAAAGPPPGFDEQLNSHLTPPSPPRQLKVLSTDEAFSFFERLAKELLEVTTIPAAIHDFASLRSFIEAFSDAKPLALSRSALHLQLAPRTWEGGDKGPPPKWALSAAMLASAMLGDDAAGAAGRPPPPSSSPRSADLDTLLEQAVIALGNWVQATLLNRARQRRRLRRGCEDMANLYQHALIAEACPLAGAKLVAGGWRWRPLAADDPQGPLATFVEKETAWQMASHLLLGFELELVEPGEVPMLYWYADFLLGTCQQGLAALSAARPKEQQAKQQGLRAVAAAAAAPYREQLQLDAMRAMCQGMFRLSLALGACGCVQGGGAAVEGAAAEQFELRFGFFAGVVERPEPLSYSQYLAASDLSAVPLSRLLELAAESFNRAKGLSDLSIGSADKLGLSEAQKREFALLARTASANALAAAMLLKAGTASSGGGEAPFVGSYEMNKSHRWFPILSLKGRRW